MGHGTLGELEAKFADMIWARAPVAMGQLVELCQRELGWKRTTTYTVLKRLCQKGLFSLDRGEVTACVTKEEYYADQGRRFIEDRFNGSLPSFVSAFVSGRGLKPQEAEELRQMIDKYAQENEEGQGDK